MGAIFGFIGDAAPGLLRAMGDRLQHRGDSRAGWTGDHVSLGMWGHDDGGGIASGDDFLVAADADVFNVHDIRREWSADVPPDRRLSSQEAILLGYRAFGAALCQKLIGDFAFVIWDRDSRSLFLARDALGSRPLFYWKNDSIFAFASEYKALLALPFVPAVPDKEAIQYLQYTKYPPPNKTLLNGVMSLPAGYHATYQNGALRKEQYWHVNVDTIDAPEEHHVNALRETFLKVVKRQVGDAREIGVTLSGGVDSAAIAAAVKNVKPDVTLHTFTCGYGPDDPEVRSAAIVAETLGTTHHNIFVTPQDIPSTLRRLVWHLEDPIARTETVLGFETAKCASEHVDVVLAGHAGDGLFGGMPRHKLIRLIEWFPPLRTPVEEFYDYTQVSVMPETFMGRALHFAYYRGGHAEPPDVREVDMKPPRPKMPLAGGELLNHVLLSGMEGGIAKWMPKVDRTHMAHGLRYRSPFTDVELIQRSFQIPGKFKIHRWREKHIFREAVRPLLPQEIWSRPKFPQAMQYDLELGQVLDRLADDILSEQRVRERGFFKVADIERLRRRNAKGAYSAEQLMRLWTAILTEVWAQIYVDGQANPSCI